MIPSGTVCPDAATERRQVFVDAAREAFFTNGYAGTTMSSIAGKVGGSKTTLWTYFPSKELLFAAVVDDIVEHYGRPLEVELSLDEEPRVVLLRFVQALMETILSEPVLALHRLVMAEAIRFPHLAEAFYTRGPRRGKARLAEYMARAMDKQQLRAGDPMLATRQFVGLCQSGSFQTALFNLDQLAEEGALAEELDAAVDTFLRAWAC